MYIIDQPGPDLHTTDWLSRENHAENRDKEVSDLQLCINAISAVPDIITCMTLCDL